MLVGWAVLLSLLPVLLSVSGCSSAPPPPVAVSASVAPAAPPPPDPRVEAAERFYRGKAAALTGDVDCARIEFDAALEHFRAHARPGDDDDLRFAQQLYESVRLYRPLLDGRDGEEERPPADAETESLLADTQQPTPAEVEAAKREVGEAPGGLAFDIPMTVNEPVLRAVASYQFRSPKAFAAALKRSGAYLPEMRRLLREQGLPQDLVYVALIESGFRGSAHSRKGAHGFWQFIAPTGARYGMKRDRWVDERSDFVKSTLAAAAYFRDLYEMFGDWHLAMAAYDTGEGRILRGLQRTGARDYWELRASGVLHKETVAYVPLVLGAALIAKDPARFGFDVVPDSPLSWDTVELPRPVDLASLAARTGLDLESLRELNPELRTRRTPRGVSSYALRVPPSTGPLVVAALGGLPAAGSGGERRVAARRGDTPARLATRYGVDVDEVCALNDLAPNAKLRKGTKVLIPLAEPGGDRPARVRPGSTPSAVVASAVPVRSRGEVRALPTPSAAVQDAGQLVAPGLSAPPGVTVSRPLPGRYEIPAAGFEPTRSEPSARAPRVAATSVAPRVHTVRKGETLYRIARQYGTTVEALREENDLRRSSKLSVGRKLTVPSRAAR